MKRLLLCLGIIGGIAYLNISSFAIDPTIYKGNKNAWGMIYVTSASINAISAVKGSTSLPIISSTTYLNKADVVLTNDPNGADVFLSSSTGMNTYTGFGCYKLYPGSSLSCDGKNLDAIYGRTLAGSTNGTTVWYIISYQDR